MKNKSEKVSALPRVQVFKGKVSFANRTGVYVLLVWTLLIGFFFFYEIKQDREVTQKLAKKEVKTALKKDMSVRSWAASHGGVYVLENERTPANPNLSHVPERDLITPSGKRLTLMNAAYVMRQIQSEHSELYGLRGRLVSMTPLNPMNKANGWEQKALKSFERGKKEFLSSWEENGIPYIGHMLPLVTEKVCLNCHSDQGLQEGDVQGGIGVSLNMEPYVDLERERILQHLWVHGTIWSLGFFGIIFAMKRAQSQTQKQVQAEMALKESQKLAAIGQLSAGVSHEVLNPLNIISIQNQILEKNNRENEKLQTFCHKVNHEIERIKKIMNALLVFSRKSEPKFKKGFLNDDIEKVLELIEEEYKLDNIRITRNRCIEPTQVSYDPDKIRQVLLNLLQNAKYAMPNGGTISLGCSEINRDGKKYMQLKISDTGTGMSEEVRQRVFDPFFTTKPEGEGTGMGLSVIHGIVEEHDGEITIESQEGQGTTFFIVLPAS